MRRIICILLTFFIAFNMMGQVQEKTSCKVNDPGTKNSSSFNRCASCLYKPKPFRPKERPDRQFYILDDDFTYISPCEAKAGIKVFFESCNGSPYENAIPAALEEYNNAHIATNFVIVSNENDADLVIRCFQGGCCGCGSAAFPDPNVMLIENPPNQQTFFPSGGSIGSQIFLDVNWTECICTSAQLNQCFFKHTVMHEIAHTLGFYHNDELGPDPAYVIGTPIGFDPGSIINSGSGENNIGNFCTASCQFNTNDIKALQTLYPISPLLNSTYVTVSCADNSFDLSTLQPFSMLPNRTMVWSTDSDPSDGVSPVISSIVTESGKYYAYFYYEIDNCFTEPTEVTVGFCCGDQVQTTISNNTTVTGNKFYRGNVIVENGATLYFDLANIQFVANSGILVKNGGKLQIKGSTIDVCNPSQSWAGIKVESGGFISAEQSFLKNVTNGVDAYVNGTLRIDKLEINGKGNSIGIGLKLNGNVNLESIYNLDIKDFNIGIQTYSSSKVHAFNHGSIYNTTFGILSTGATILVNDYDINFTKEGITLIAAPGSSIFDTDIVYSQQGIAITLSPFTRVEGGSVSNKSWTYGTEYLNEKPAISIVFSDYCTVMNNFPISSATNAISVWGSNNANVDNNSISTYFGNNGVLTGGPVNLQFGNRHKVTNNYIYADESEFGINSTWAGGSTIGNNTIYNYGFKKLFRTAAIKAEGNIDEQIIQNTILAYDRDGIFVHSTTGNSFLCNEVFSDGIAQEISDLSGHQFIKANTLLGHELDMKIKSEIGLQATVNASGNVVENNGNVFLGGNAEADFSVYLNSQFPYNPIYPDHSPANPNPSSDWFIPNNITAYADCNGVLIGDNQIYGNDPNRICTYWNYLKSIRNSKPELFFVKLVHLLKYSKMKSGFNLPNCIKNDVVFQSLCGVSKIVDVSVALAKISESPVNSSTIMALQEQYIGESSDAGKKAAIEQMSTEISSIQSMYEYDRNADSLRLDSLKTELNSINCSSIIINKWKEILKIYINFIRQGIVQGNDRSALESYSTDCADVYGEAIHLARAMANTYNRTYYDVYDGCIDTAVPRTNIQTRAVDVTVSPNPTNGRIVVAFSSAFTGTLTIYDCSGHKVKSLSLENRSSIDIDLADEHAGMYVIRATSQDGVSKECKVVLIK